MAKKKVEKPKREFTKRQHSRWQQQKRRQRIIFGLGILIVVAVLAIVGVGIYVTQYLPNKPLHETVIEVNGTEFDMDYYIKMVENLALQYQAYGISVTTDILSSLTGSAETAVEQNELIMQGAMELGVTVSDDEVDEVLNSYDPPVSKEYRDFIGDLVRTELLTERLLDAYFEEEVPRFADQRHIIAMFLESRSQANEVKDRLEAGEDFAELASDFSLDDFSRENEGDIGWQAEGVLSLRPEDVQSLVPEDVWSSMLYIPIVDEYAFNCEVGVLSEPVYDETRTKTVGYWLIEVLERTEVEEAVEEEEAAEEEEAVKEEEPVVEIKLRLILLGSEQEANVVRAMLETGGDFAELASEYSQHSASKDNGGEFKVSSLDTMTSAFREFVFDPEVELGSLSQPIRDEEVGTSGGYWLIEVTEAEENREIAEEDRDSLKADALSEWIEASWDNPENNIVSYLDEEKKQWAITYIMTGGQVE